MRIYLLIIFFSFFSCSNDSNFIDASILVSNKYYQFYKRNEIDSIGSIFCSVDANQKIDTADLFQNIRQMHDKFGSNITYQLARKSIKYSIENKNKTKFIILTYKVIYSPDYTAKETFLFYLDNKFKGKINEISTTEWGDED